MGRYARILLCQGEEMSESKMQEMVVVDSVRSIDPKGSTSIC